MPYIYDMGQTALRGHLQGVLRSSWPLRNTMRTNLNFAPVNSSSWPTVLKCIHYTPWILPSKGTNMLELRIVLIKLWFNKIWVHVSVFIRYSDICARIWTRQTSQKFRCNCQTHSQRSHWGSDVTERRFEFRAAHKFVCVFLHQLRWISSSTPKEM